MNHLFKFNIYKVLILFGIFILPSFIFDLGIIDFGSGISISIIISIFPLIFGPIYSLNIININSFDIYINEHFLLFSIMIFIILLYWLLMSSFIYNTIKKLKKSKVYK
ncbi:hypothetical protein HN415_02410 [Candidatus Woesearchaeota archaeon]|jgi:hypothetical protein|nr:hypothetical protein [Candidatus Woesearchaeota archaeon]